jgi:hypothetical protein
MVYSSYYQASPGKLPNDERTPIQMSKTATKYDVIVNGETVATKGKKAVAIELARTERKTNLADVKVVTTAGTVVFELAAPKKIKMSKPFTRVVAVPEGVVLPGDEWRPAYDRSRKNLFILHNSETGEYAVFNFVTQEFLAEELATTREAGAFCKTVPVPAKA